MTAPTTLWFKPVCDHLLFKVHHWYQNYEKGEVYSTRDWLNLDGVKIERPTRYACRIAFRAQEIQHLSNIMNALAPKFYCLDEKGAVRERFETKAEADNWVKKQINLHRVTPNPLISDIAELNAGIQRRFNNIPLKNRPRLLPTGEWVIQLAWYLQDIEEVIRTLVQAKTGRVQTFEALVEQKKAEGKDLFEV